MHYILTPTNKSMKRLLKTTLLLGITCCMSHTAWAEKSPSMTDYNAAKVAAVEQKKDLFLEFTGSDWCTWCIVMKREILDQAEFHAATKDKFIFVELDYPEKKKQPPELVAQNKALDKIHNIEGYPTIILCDASGKAYAITGYEEGDTVESYVRQLEAFQAIRVRRDEAFAAAEKTEAPAEKAKLIIAGLSTMDETVVDTYYQDEIKKLSSLDPEGTAEYVAARKASMVQKAEEKKKMEEEERNYAKIEPFLQTLEPLMQAKKFDEAIAAWEVFDKEKADIPAEMKQFLLHDIKVRQAMEKKDLVAIDALCDKYAESHPKSFLAENLAAVKEAYKKEMAAAEKAE